MTMFVLYKTVPASQIRKEAKRAIKGITKWFKDNPTRKICRSEFWYGVQVNVKPNTVAEQVNAAADKAIETHKPPQGKKAKSKKHAPA